MTGLPDYDDPKLTPQEEWLVRCAERGEWWKHTDEPGNPVAADSWDSSRVLRACVVRALAAGSIWPTRLVPWSVHRKGLMITGAWIWGPIDLEGATVERTLWFYSSAFDNEFLLLDAKTKTVSFQGSHLPGLDASRCNIEGSLYLSDGFSAKGEVDLSGATIGGQLGCKAGSFDNATGTALNCHTITVGASALLIDGFSAKGEVNFARATIKGQLACRNGAFDNPAGRALNCEVITVGADVLLIQGFVAKGHVSFLRATIDGQLSCANGCFHNPGGTALDCEAITVGADVFLFQGFSADGEVDFVNSKIGSNLYCTYGTFKNATAEALDLSRAQIGAGLFIRSLKPADGAQTGMNGRLLLSQASCRTYRDDRTSWPEKGKLVLDGFSYERFDDCATDCKTRCEWLSLQFDDHLKDNFRPQPWTQAMKVLRDMGYDREARNLGLEFEKVRERRRSVPWYWRAWHHFTYVTIGCGYKPEWAVYWSIGFVLFGWLTFAMAANIGFMAPREGNVVAYIAAHPNEPLPRYYTQYNAFVYSLDAYLPVIELGQDLAWEPAVEQHMGVRKLALDEGDWTCAKRVLSGQNAAWKKDEEPRKNEYCGFSNDPKWALAFADLFRHGVHRFVYWVVELAGWVFISLFIAGMSGLMKKE